MDWVNGGLTSRKLIKISVNIFLHHQEVQEVEVVIQNQAGAR